MARRGEPRPVSPAAAGYVSRILGDAHIERETRLYGRVLPGYWASPNGDHVLVEWSQTTAAEVEDGLHRCRVALEGRGYAVTVKRPVTPAGMALEVRKPSWTVGGG